MAKQNRKKKTDSRPADVGTPVSSDVTPMPSPDQQSPCAPLEKTYKSRVVLFLTVIGV